MIGPRDTDPDVEAWRDEQLRQLSAAEKLERVGALTHLLREFAKGEVRARMPDAPSALIDRLAARRWIDESLLEKAYGPVPDSVG
jgi:hypothetical protein